MKLNCDLGEGFGIYRHTDDAEIMPYIDMANLACGFHASDPVHMLESIRLAKRHKVTIGAHPGYPDLQGFGRRIMHCSADEIEAMLLYQIGALDAMCRAEGIVVSYVKPHGALYNQMMQDVTLFEVIVRTISQYRSDLALVTLFVPEYESYEKIARKYGIELLFELFADRAYDDNGRLLGRREEGALIEDKREIVQRMEHLLKEGYLESYYGKRLEMKADTLCVHSDTATAVDLVESLKELLERYRDR